MFSISLEKISYHLVVNVLERYFFGGRDALKVIVFGSGSFRSVGLLNNLDAHGTKTGLHRLRGAAQDNSPYRVISDPNGRSFVKENSC